MSPRTPPSPLKLNRPRLAAVAPAFSLIEILIAVLILALGLLGLGAVFPVIVREQKLGNDIIVGTVAANSARTMLQGMDLAAASGNPLFWQTARTQLTPNDYELGQWAPSYMDDPSDGIISFGSVSDPGVGVEIPVAARLYPVDAPASGPQYVWDAAIQRVPDDDTDPNNDDLRVAIFVRRVDQRIRFAGRETLFWVLTQRSGVNTALWRVPVAEDSDGVPTYDGHGGDTRPTYSQIRTVNVRFDYSVNGAPDKRRRDRLYADTATVENSVEWRLAKQPNQKLIDNFGNVYTVMESGEANGDEFIRVSPEVPAYITQNDQIVQVAFTPQVAAAIVTWRVTP